MITAPQILAKLQPLPVDLQARVVHVGPDCLNAADWRIEIYRMEEGRELSAIAYLDSSDAVYVGAIRAKLVTLHWAYLKRGVTTKAEYEWLREQMKPFSLMEELTGGNPYRETRRRSAGGMQSSQ